MRYLLDFGGSEEPPERFQRFSGEHDSIIVLMPLSSRTVDVDTFEPLTGEQMGLITSREDVALRVWIAITYDDVFGQHHLVRSCFRWYPSAKSFYGCRSGNSYK